MENSDGSSNKIEDSDEIPKPTLPNSPPTTDNMDLDRKDDRSASAQALLEPNDTYLYSPQKNIINPSPYEIHDSPFPIATTLLPEKAQTQPASPHIEKILTTKTSNNFVGIENFDPKKIITFTEPSTLRAIERLGADTRDLFYPTDADLSRYGNDPELLAIAREHQIDRTNRLIMEVKIERMRILEQKSLTQNNSPRINYQNENLSATLPPLSKKKIIEQKLIEVVKKKNPKKPPQTATKSNGRSQSSNAALPATRLASRVSNAVLRARQIEEAQKEEKRRLQIEREMRAQKRMQELQLVKLNESTRKREKNDQKKLQYELFALKQADEKSIRLMNLELEELQQKMKRKANEEEKRHRSDMARMAIPEATSKVDEINLRVQIESEIKRIENDNLMQRHEELHELHREKRARELKRKNMELQLAAEDHQKRREMNEKRKIMLKKENMDRILMKFAEIEEKKEIQRQKAYASERTTFSLDEVELDQYYQAALEIDENTDEETLIKIAKGIGLDIEDLMKQVKQ